IVRNSPSNSLSNNISETHGDSIVDSRYRNVYRNVVAWAQTRCEEMSIESASENQGSIIWGQRVWTIKTKENRIIDASARVKNEYMRWTHLAKGLASPLRSNRRTVR